MKIDKSWYQKPDKDFPTRVAAGGIVVRIENGKPLIGLIQDTRFPDWHLPKGRVEEGEDVETAARREIAEETGLTNLQLICNLETDERLSFKKDTWLTFYYFLFKTNQKEGHQNLKEDEEHLIFKWFSLKKLPSMFWPEQRELIEKNLEKIKNVTEYF